MKERNNPYTTRYEEATKNIEQEAQNSQAISDERRSKQNEIRISRRQGALALGLAIAALALPNVLGGNEAKTSDKVPSGEKVEKLDN